VFGRGAVAESAGSRDVRYAPDSNQILRRSEMTRSATNGLMHRSKFAVMARTFIALSCLVAGQEFMQLSALMLAHRGDWDRAHHFWQLQ
jgi:hypothetical protein